MHNLRAQFNNVSLLKKIPFIISVTFVCIYTVFFLSIHFLTDRYERELYQTNAQALKHVSAAITSELQMVESISASIIGDSVIQNNLYFLKNNPSSNRRALARRDLYQALYPYIFNDRYIKSIHILFEDHTDICMGNSSDLDQFNSSDINQRAYKAEGRLLWETALSAGSDIAASREIRQLKYFNLQKLANLIIVVDLEQLIHDALADSGYSSEVSPFILLSGQTQFYPKAAYHQELYRELCASIKEQENSYTIRSIDGKKEFILMGSIPYTGWDYLFFRDYDPVFHDIQAARFHILALTVCFGVAALLLVQIIFLRILIHLNYLVEKIKRFGNGTLDPSEETTAAYKNRKDEIGQLHVSFDEMTKSVKVLRDENYDKQLLLRDATIKMLQQQINPHFLYNTLDTINWMAQKCGADNISIMVRSLGNLFRASIVGQEDLVSLSDELSFLDDYILIQKIRFKDRLVFEMTAPENASHIFVPKLCIQPLVENALKHAMEYSDEICTIHVSIQEQETHYQIKVANTGSQFEENLLWKIEHKVIPQQGSGVGLVNIDSRLRLLYGDQYGLRFYNKDGMAVVLLTIPKERKNSHAPLNDC